MTIRNRAGAVTLALFCVWLASSSMAADAKPILVKIHADWCGTCQRLKPTWSRLESDFGDRAEFVVFDVTSRKTLNAARERAHRLGLDAVFDRYRSRTGTVIVLDGATHVPIGVLYGETDVAPYVRLFLPTNPS